MTFEQGELILYQSEDGRAVVDVRLKDNTVWLTLNQMAELFARDKSVISRHLRNIFQSQELDRSTVVAKNATTAADGKTYQVDYYNFDAIISVGYRVNSKRGTQFRIWATSVLKDHLIKGYTLNQKRLAETGLAEARQMMELLMNTLKGHELVTDEGQAVLGIVTGYARTWQLLWQYDEDSLTVPKVKGRKPVVFKLKQVRHAIDLLKKELMFKAEATEIFGQERGNGLEGILGAIRQTFGGRELYETVEEKAANLLYFIIKDHPFVDGNKRIGSFLFLLFLDLNRKFLSFDNKAMVALTLLTASSDPSQKDLLIRLIINLLTDDRGSNGTCVATA